MQTETGSQGTLGESGGRRHEVHSFGRLFGRHTMRFLSGKAVFGWAFVSGDCVAATDDAGHESLVIRHNRMLRSCSHQTIAVLSMSASAPRFDAIAASAVIGLG